MIPSVIAAARLLALLQTAAGVTIFNGQQGKQLNCLHPTQRTQRTF